MLDEKLRIAPTVSRAASPAGDVRPRDELFYDEGLKTGDGSLAYQILRDPMVPFGLEKLGISQAMKESQSTFPSMYNRGLCFLEVDGCGRTS
jgi:hypothetical protein